MRPINLKIAIVCDSPLLKKCLEVFLKEHLSSYSACNFVISDKKIDSEKPVFVISDEKGANLRKPFSKTKLLKALDEYFRRMRQPKSSPSPIQKLETGELENKLKILTENFVSELVRTIKECR
jgi:hypothetical protein